MKYNKNIFLHSTFKLNLKLKRIIISANLLRMCSILNQSGDLVSKCADNPSYFACKTWMVFFVIISRTKWKSHLMCFVLSCNTGLDLSFAWQVYRKSISLPATFMIQLAQKELFSRTHRNIYGFRSRYSNLIKSRRYFSPWRINATATLGIIKKHRSSLVSSISKILFKIYLVCWFPHYHML